MYNIHCIYEDIKYIFVNDSQMHFMEVTCLQALRNSPQQLGGEFCSLARGLNTGEKSEGVQLSD